MQQAADVETIIDSSQPFIIRVTRPREHFRSGSGIREIKIDRLETEDQTLRESVLKAVKAAIKGKTVHDTERSVDPDTRQVSYKRTPRKAKPEDVTAATLYLHEVTGDRIGARTNSYVMFLLRGRKYQVDMKGRAFHECALCGETFERFVEPKPGRFVHEGCLKQEFRRAQRRQSRAEYEVLANL